MDLALKEDLPPVTSSGDETSGDEYVVEREKREKKTGPSKEERLQRYERKKEKDRQRAQRKREETQNRIKQLVEENDRLKDQMKTVKFLAAAVHQYYDKHELDGLTDQTREKVLKWMTRMNKSWFMFYVLYYIYLVIYL